MEDLSFTTALFVPSSEEYFNDFTILSQGECVASQNHHGSGGEEAPSRAKHRCDHAVFYLSFYWEVLKTRMVLAIVAELAAVSILDNRFYFFLVLLVYYYMVTMSMYTETIYCFVRREI
jgi:hypothetical protein